MFKFDFNVDSEAENTADQQQEPTKKSSSDAFECEEIVLPKALQHGYIIDPDELHVFIASVDIQVEYINCASLSVDHLSIDVQKAEGDHSDLIPGRYEGGLKVWECTFDLGELVTENEKYRNRFKNGTILDLGCGSGILGILAVKMGAAKVVFQDYNRDVLQELTAKNYSINCLESEENEEDKQENFGAEVKFYSGDWVSFSEKVDEKYDVILTSETIYNMNNYGKLIDLLKTKLKPDGVVLLAAKTYYFGVGGGIRSFEQAVEEDGALSCRTAWECDDGVKREILELQLRDTDEAAAATTTTPTTDK